MNSWANEQFAIQNMMHPNMIPNMMPPGAMAPPLMMVASNLMQENNQMPMQPMVTHHVNPPQLATQFIGPVIPENVSAQVETVPENVQDQTQEEGNGQDNKQEKSKSRDKSDRRDRERERERRRRSRSRNRDHNKDRNDRGDRNRSDHRDRHSKWDNHGRAMQQQDHMQPHNHNMMIPGQHNMMQFGNMMPNMQNPMTNQQMEMTNMQNSMLNQQVDMTNMQNPMLNQQVDMTNMQNPMLNQQVDMTNMQNPMLNQQVDMTNMQNPMLNQQVDMTNMQHMMPGMNMMPNNMMMMNQQMQMSNQHIYFSNGVILPALPGTTIPQRREKPHGCRTIFIGGLPNGISENNIKEIFQRFGAIDEVKMHKQGVCHVRFEKQESVEQSFFMSGSRIKFHDQMENEATTLIIDYSLNREDQNEFERNRRRRTPTPPRIEQYSAATLAIVGEKIKSDHEFVEAAPTLAAWLERGECSKKNAGTFYALIQATNNQLRRLFNEKMQIDDEYQTLRSSIRDRFGHIILQFEQVAKILTAATVQRVSDHFSKQQRRNIEMWLKMTEELNNIRDEFNAIFDEEEIEKSAGKPSVSLEKYEELRTENENLQYELEGYKNEAHLAKDEAERKFEKFKAHYIAEQALQHRKQVYPPLPPPPMPNLPMDRNAKPQPPPPLPADASSSGVEVKASEAKLISILSAFLMVHPLGATLDYLVSYVKSLTPNVTQSAVHDVLKKYNDVFSRKTTGIGARIEHKWCIVIFDGMKIE